MGGSSLDSVGSEQPLPDDDDITSNIPEVVKLVAASVLVAMILHFVFFQKSIHLSSVGSSKGDTVGSIDHLAQGEDVTSTASSQKISSCDSLQQKQPAEAQSNAKAKKSKKDKNAVQKASATRNYDKLIQMIDSPDAKVDLKPDEDDDADENKSPEKQITTTSTTIPTNEAILTQQQHTPPKLHTNAQHPGLTPYYTWHTTITSLYRIYSTPTRNIQTNTLHPAILPMQPSSERGNVSIHITVVNQTKYEVIQVYWIDYKGREVYKGSIAKGGMWNQTTYIGHPWTFRVGSGEEGVLVKYVPFRIVPNVIGAETMDRSGSFIDTVGTQSFIMRNVPEGYVTRQEGYEPSCWIEDIILPEAPLINTYYNNGERNLSLFTVQEMELAVQWSCYQLQREEVCSPGVGITGAKRVLQYLTNIQLHPENVKYRRLRISNRIFFESVYSTGARGVLLAVGFEEHFGFMECGTNGRLNYERLRHISTAIEMVERTLKVMMESEEVTQPDGADGYGRAGFGYAGTMNL